jgi:hypothetical protein
MFLSFQKPVEIPGLGLVDDSDIVRFDPGTQKFASYFVGSTAGLTKTAENIDALAFAADGRLVVSTTGLLEAPRTSGGTLRSQDEDLSVYDAASNTWEVYFDGSDVGLDSSTEDVVSVWIDPTLGELYLSTRGTYAVPGLVGDRDDILRFFPSSLGADTRGIFRVAWDGRAHGYGGKPIDGISLVPLPESSPGSAPGVGGPLEATNDVGTMSSVSETSSTHSPAANDDRLSLISVDGDVSLDLPASTAPIRATPLALDVALGQLASAQEATAEADLVLLLADMAVDDPLDVE